MPCHAHEELQIKLINEIMIALLKIEMRHEHKPEIKCYSQCCEAFSMSMDLMLRATK